MGLFDYFKFKKDEQKAFALQQQIVSLKEEVSFEEKKKEELQSQVQKLQNQITDLNNQVVVQRNELHDLQEAKEKAKKQAKKVTDKYESLDKVLKTSTRQVKGIPSSDYTPLVHLSDKYLISVDEDDFQELSKYYSLREENKSFCEKKGQMEKELQALEKKMKEGNDELLRLREELVKQRDVNHDFEVKTLKEAIAYYSNELHEIQEDIDGYLKTHKEKLRLEMIHEIYRRFTACEDDALRKLRLDIDGVNLIKMHESMWEDRNIFRNGWLIKEDGILSNVQKMCEDFIQLNIEKLTREMKSSDWESIKLKIGSVIQIVEGFLFIHGYTISESYFESLYNIMEAKFIRIQKQELEKEKVREEREAQREYERAIKKALKDEEKAQEALEKKRRELAEEQTQEKIIKLQEQIQGLEKALADARELRERAMSMAQQTKIGYVYVISNIGSFGKDVYKIGMTRRLDPMERILELSNASVPFPFDVHTFIYSEDAPALEADLHRIFDSKKVNTINYRKEYFHVTLDEIKSALAERGVDAKFVDEPDAFQYRESLSNHNNRVFKNQ